MTSGEAHQPLPRLIGSTTNTIFNTYTKSLRRNESNDSDDMNFLYKMAEIPSVNMPVGDKIDNGRGPSSSMSGK
jgi:hypothetical protein